MFRWEVKGLIDSYNCLLLLLPDSPEKEEYRQKTVRLIKSFEEIDATISPKDSDDYFDIIPEDSVGKIDARVNGCLIKKLKLAESVLQELKADPKTYSKTYPKNEEQLREASVKIAEVSRKSTDFIEFVKCADDLLDQWIRKVAGSEIETYVLLLEEFARVQPAVLTDRDRLLHLLSIRPEGPLDFQAHAQMVFANSKILNTKQIDYLALSEIFKNNPGKLIGPNFDMKDSQALIQQIASLNIILSKQIEAYKQARQAEEDGKQYIKGNLAFITHLTGVRAQVIKLCVTLADRYRDLGDEPKASYYLKESEKLSGNLNYPETLAPIICSQDSEGQLNSLKAVIVKLEDKIKSLPRQEKDRSIVKEGEVKIDADVAKMLQESVKVKEQCVRLSTQIVALYQELATLIPQKTVRYKELSVYFLKNLSPGDLSLEELKSKQATLEKTVRHLQREKQRVTVPSPTGLSILGQFAPSVSAPASPVVANSANQKITGPII